MHGGKEWRNCDDIRGGGNIFPSSTFVDMDENRIGLRTRLDFDFNRTTTLRNKNSPAHARAWEQG